MLLALVVGAWVGRDYLQNESDRRVNQEAIAFENRMNDINAGTDFPAAHAALMHAKEIESAERYDAMLGIVACIVLIGGIVLLSKSGKSVA